MNYSGPGYCHCPACLNIEEMSNTLNSEDIHESQSEAEIWDLAIANGRLLRAQEALMES